MQTGPRPGDRQACSTHARLFLLSVSLVVLATWVAPAVRAAEVVVRCESEGFRDRYCAVETHGGVRLARQISRAPCHQGSSWSYDRHGIWVSDGCGAEFEILPASPGHDAGAGYHRDSPGQYARGDEEIPCESRDFRYRYCPVRNPREVELIRQTSSSNCRFNRSWGFDRGGIWVDQGCAAVFRVRW
jgi:hypothetical protein